MLKDVKYIDPRDKHYCFRMSKFDCFYRKTGKCSLDLSNLKVNDYLIKEGLIENYTLEAASYFHYAENSVMYCKLLANSILTEGYNNKEGVIVCKNSCGHFSSDGGQHRLCIGKKLALPKVPLERYSESEDICVHCDSKASNIVYRIQSYLNKSYWFIC